MQGIVFLQVTLLELANSGIMLVNILIGPENETFVVLGVFLSEKIHL